MTMNRFLILLMLASLIACSKSGKVNTPKEFVNHVVVNPSLYSGDSASILRNLYNKMKNHEAPFQNRQYFDSTQLYIDTLLYDNSFNKVVLFVIAENPIRRNPYAVSALPYYYNANCFLGKRLIGNPAIFDLEAIGPISIINFEDKAMASKAIREGYFSKLTTSLDANGSPHYDYNVDDKRFWESPKGWKRVFP
jgi:hypothetical protein